MVSTLVFRGPRSGSECKDQGVQIITVQGPPMLRLYIRPDREVPEDAPVSCQAGIDRSRQWKAC